MSFHSEHFCMASFLAVVLLEVDGTSCCYDFNLSLGENFPLTNLLGLQSLGLVELLGLAPSLALELSLLRKIMKCFF